MFLVLSSAPRAKDICRLQSASLALIIEPRFGLLPELISQGVLTLQEAAQVEQRKLNCTDAASKLLDILSSKSDDVFDNCHFTLALQKTDQCHVSNWIYLRGSEFLLYSKVLFDLS